MALTGCCGCRNLKRGCIAIAITLIVLYVAAVLIDSGHLIYQVVHGADVSKASVIIGIGYAIQIAGICFNVALIMGVKRASRSMILSWVIFHGIIFAITSLCIVCLVVILCLAAGSVVKDLDIGTLVVFTLIFAVLNAVEWYWFAVVVAHMNELDDASLEFAYRRQDERVVMNTKDTV